MSEPTEQATSGTVTNKNRGEEKGSSGNARRSAKGKNQRRGQSKGNAAAVINLASKDFKGLCENLDVLVIPTEKIDKKSSCHKFMENLRILRCSLCG